MTDSSLVDVTMALEVIRGGGDDAKVHMRRLLKYPVALRSAADADPMALVLHMSNHELELKDAEMARVGNAILDVRVEEEFVEIVEGALTLKQRLRMGIGFWDLPSAVPLALSRDDVVDVLRMVVDLEHIDLEQDEDGIFEERGAGKILYLQALGQIMADRDDWDQILEIVVDVTYGLTVQDWLIIACWYEMGRPRVEMVGDVGYSEEVTPDIFIAVGIDRDVALVRIAELLDGGGMPEIDPRALRAARRESERRHKEAVASRKAAEALDEAADDADI